MLIRYVSELLDLWKLHLDVPGSLTGLKLCNSLVSDRNSVIQFTMAFDSERVAGGPVAVVFSNGAGKTPENEIFLRYLAHMPI